MKLYRFITGPDEAAFCHRITGELNKGWQLYGQPALTFDAVKGRVICGQVIIKDAPGDYHDGIKLSEQ